MMKTLLVFCLSLFTFVALADTPPPGTVKAKMFTGDGNTALTATSGALNVNVTNSGGLSTVNQGNAGIQSWLASITSSALPTNACKETGGYLESIDEKLGDPLAVTGTFWQATQPISGSVSVSNFPATQPVSGFVNVANFPSSQAVTGTFWQATQPISGSVSVSNFPSSQAVTGTFWQATQPVSLSTLPSLATGANTIGAVNINGTVPISGTITATNTANGTTGLTSPTQATRVAGDDGTGLLKALKVDSSGVLSVDGSNHTQPVSGTFWQATQPVSGTVTANAGTGTFTVDASGFTVPVSGTFWQATQPVSGTFWQATQPVSAASLPLPSGAATSANQTTANGSLSTIATNTGNIPALGQALAAGSVPVVLTAAQISTLTPLSSVTVTQGTGSNLHTVVDSSALPTGAATDTLQTAGNGSLSTIATNTGRIPAQGQALAAASLPVVLTAAQISTLTPLSSVTVTQGTGTNLHVVVDSAPTTAVTQSGTWTINTTPVGGSASSQTTGTVSTVITLTAPSNAQGFILQNLQSSTANVRFAMGATATTTLGMQLAPGQDSGFVPAGVNVSLVAESGTQNYNIQWVSK